MKRISGADKALFGSEVSSADANRFYSILLDARASKVSQSMYDVAEKLLTSEKENAKLSLEQLWTLKNDVEGDAGTGTVGLLIQFYQDKITVLRSKEEHIKEITRDSRKLLEDKRSKDSEVATVKQEIADCTAELDQLKAKLDKLKVREQELTLIGEQLKKELQVNENEIVNGLYEIILSHKDQLFGGDLPVDTEDSGGEGRQEQGESAGGTGVEQAEETGESAEETEAPRADAGQPADAAAEPADEDERAETEAPEPPLAAFQEQADTGAPVAVLDESRPEEAENAEEEDDKSEVRERIEELYKQVQAPPAPPYPRSVVKTTRGRVIGEYYYDSKVYKNERHYVFNSMFFCEQLRIGIDLLRDHFDKTTYSDLLQMIQDAHKRISENPNIHFEIATNELLNESSFKELWQQLKLRSYDEVARFCGRLDAKLKALSSNYSGLLREQMERLVTG